MVAIEYAKALYELAIEEKIIDEISNNFEALIKTINDVEFINVLSSPVISIEKKKEIIGKVYSSLNTTFINFIYVIIDHNRLNVINDIHNEFIKIVNEKKNVLLIDVYSTYKLKNEELEKITNALKKIYDKKLEIKNIIDEKLIGGVKIVCNGEVIDITAKNSLNKLKERL